MNNLNHIIWDNEQQEYVGTLPDGRRIHVSGDVWAEQLQRGVSETELVVPSTWENCVDDEKVYIVEDMSYESGVYMGQRTSF